MIRFDAQVVLIWSVMTLSLVPESFSHIPFAVENDLILKHSQAQKPGA